MTKDVFEKLGDLIKVKLKNVTQSEMKRNIISHYQLLHLMNYEEKWASEILEERREYLLPEGLTMSDICDFIDSVVETNSKNQYLRKILPKLSKRKYNYLVHKFETEGNDVIPKVVAYAYVLEKLTKECADDWRVFENLFYIFRQAREDSNAFNHLPLFHKIKLMSVDKPLEKSYLTYFTKNKVPYNSGAAVVQVNIFEATVTDVLSKNRWNAYAGWVLTKYRCGLKKQDCRTGAGPSGFSEDGKMIERRYPLPRKWAALYQTWNMAFVTRFKDFPYVICKLLIPQVAGYQDKPYNYIYNRAMALVIYLNFAGFDYVKKQKEGVEVMDWYDRKLQLSWGRCNREIGKRYEKAVRKKRTNIRHN